MAKNSILEAQHSFKVWQNRKNGIQGQDHIIMDM